MGASNSQVGYRLIWPSQESTFQPKFCDKICSIMTTVSGKGVKNVPDLFPGEIFLKMYGVYLISCDSKDNLYFSLYCQFHPTHMLKCGRDLQKLT